MYLGPVSLSATLLRRVLVKTSAKVPINADALPTFRVLGPSGLVLTGTASLAQTGSVTGATNASPIVITSAAHGLNDGTRVTITGVGGNTAANTSAQVASSATNTFAMSGVAGNGSYTSGGTWNVSGLYSISIVCSTGNGFAAGSYQVQVSGAHSSGTAFSELFSFTVI